MLAKHQRQPREAVAAFRESARLLEVLKGRHPRSPAYQLKLATSLVDLNEALAAAAPAEAEAGLVTALDKLKALVAEYQDVPEYRRALGRGHFQLGRLFAARKEFDKAVVHAETAKALHERNLKANPDSDPDSRALIDDQNLLAVTLTDAGRLADAAAAAEQLPAIRPADPSAYYHAAAILVRCAAKSAHTADGQQFAADSLNRAVRILGDAVRAKVIRFRFWLDKDELRPLHDRDDFKKLRDSLAESVRTG